LLPANIRVDVDDDDVVENYPGIPKGYGYELMVRMQKQLTIRRASEFGMVALAAWPRWRLAPVLRLAFVRHVLAV